MWGGESCAQQITAHNNPYSSFSSLSFFPLSIQRGSTKIRKCCAEQVRNSKAKLNFKFLVSRNKPKNNRNRSCFGLFRFEPKFLFVCFQDTLPGVQNPWGADFYLLLSTRADAYLLLPTRADTYLLLPARADTYRLL